MNAHIEKLMELKGVEKLPSVLMTAAECAPFAKTGGLADVVGTLSRTLHDFGFDVRIMLPFHRVIKDSLKQNLSHVASFSIDLGWRAQYVGLELCYWEGLPVYFLDNEYYFGHSIYRGGTFEGEQYAYFSRAVLEALPIIGFEPDIIHVNDWHTAMIPTLIKTQHQLQPLGKAKTVLSLHNIGYQGRFDFGLVADMLGIDSSLNSPDYLEFHGGVNFLKGGMVFADKLVTVSPSYAEEIKTPYYGEGLNGVLEKRGDDLVGIINGINTDAYNPATDNSIAQPYAIGTLEDKQINKQALIDEMAIRIHADTPIIGVVSRLTPQKGVDLILHVFEEIIAEDVGFVLIGTGDADYEDFFREAEQRHGDRVRSIIKFDEAIAHRLYAGSDFLLMPSRFEPCGLSQMIALRYGTLPIVRETGGLKDTVASYNEYMGEGNGFSFANYNAHDMLEAIRYALSVYKDKAKYTALQKNAMAQDLGFKQSALRYAELYLNMQMAGAQSEEIN